MNISSYDYYRTSIPGWGTTQFQFKAPPAPWYQPRPTWSGWDYYRAHALNPDHNLYYTVMNRTRDFGPSSDVGMHEARIWQRRVYSGLVNLAQLLPADIGVAAAYEAYRYWKHHNRLLFAPLGSAIDRHREGLVGIAIAEASTLWQMSGRAMDAYGLRDCLESAAVTAFTIAHSILREQAEEFDGGYAPPRRSRRYSTATPVVVRAGSADMSPGFGSTPYPGSVNMPGRAGSGSSAGYAAGGSPYGGTAALPIPGRTSMQGAPMGGSPYLGGSSPYGTSAMPGTGSSPYGAPAMLGTGSSPYGAGYAGSAPGAGMAGMGTTGASYGGAGGGAPGALFNATNQGATGATYAGVPGSTYSGGYQPGVTSTGQVAYGGHSPNAFGAGMQQQPTGYAGQQTAYGASGFPQTQGAYQQQPQPYPEGGVTFPGAATVIAGGRAIPAPAGSTIFIDTKRRPRRSSHGGHERGRSQRSRSVDPFRREQPSVSYAMAAR